MLCMLPLFMDILQLRSLSCGPGTFAVAADNSVITWGAASNGELGYGPNGKKSSARPGKVGMPAAEAKSRELTVCRTAGQLFLLHTTPGCPKELEM